MADCVFLRRRYDCDRLTLEKLFATATMETSVMCISGSNSNEYGQYKANLSISDTAFNGKKTYVFVFHNGYVGIWKKGNRVYETTPIFLSGNDCGIITLNNQLGTGYYYSVGQYLNTSDSYYYGGSYCYGATMAAVNFSDMFSASEIEQMLSNITVNRLAYRDDYFSSAVRTNNKTNKVYLTACGNGMQAWNYSNNNYNKLFDSRTYYPSYPTAAYVNGSYLQLFGWSGTPSGDQAVYAGTIVGIN